VTPIVGFDRRASEIRHDPAGSPAAEAQRVLATLAVELTTEPQRDRASAPAARGEDVEELRHRTLVRVLGRLLRLRGLFIPVLLGFAAWIGLSDAAVWRQLLMLLLATVLLTVIVSDLFAARELRAGRILLLVPNLLAIAIMQHVMIFATGGMASPVVPLILVVVFLTGLLAEPRLAWAVALAVHLPALWIEAGIQLSGLIELTPTALAWPDGSSRQAPVTTVVIAALMSFATVVTTLLSTVTAAGLNRMVAEALRARDSALATHRSQTQELTGLSAEIAHELKNPLASVKGLAQLVGRELERRDDPSSKSAQRMVVLRREVDRMQEILDEFLNFSRPLIPLNLREVELRELVDHVVDLHEGVAGERRVELRARGRARLACDPRKVEQILINVVQNAIEAAPAGSVIELELLALARAGASEQVRVHVRDQGSGLAAGVRTRAFEPGVTGKLEGSGLGLTIARALARQHGGELELHEREPGPGCEAVLSLPKSPSSEPDPNPTDSTGEP
jgi:two-component system, NtrC family, sensor histidine kinase HydH